MFSPPNQTSCALVALECVSDCSFSQLIFEYPLKWCTYSEPTLGTALQTAADSVYTIQVTTIYQFTMLFDATSLGLVHLVFQCVLGYFTKTFLFVCFLFPLSTKL